MDASEPMTGRAGTILLLGSTGLLGSTLLPSLQAHGYDVKAHSRSGETQYNVNLSERSATHSLLDSIKPAVIINLAGLTNVDTCEANPNAAFLANVLAVENISNWILNSGSPCHLIQISTDQVYDSAGLHEETHVSLQNCYAFSKYAGELAASRVPGTILRTNFFGLSQCSGRSSLTDWLYQSLSSHQSIQVFDDVQFNPVSMDTLAGIIELVIREKPVGIYNLGSHGGMSKADFAFSFADALDYPTASMTRSSSDQATFINAYRPKDMRMDCSKLESTLQVKLPHLIDEIKSVSRNYCES